MGVLSNPWGSHRHPHDGATDDALPSHRSYSPRRPSFPPPTGLLSSPRAVNAMSTEVISSLPMQERRSSWLDLQTPLQFFGLLTGRVTAAVSAIAVAGFGSGHPLVSVAALAFLVVCYPIAFGTLVWMSVRHPEAVDALLGRGGRAARPGFNARRGRAPDRRERVSPPVPTQPSRPRDGAPSPSRRAAGCA